MKVIGVNKKTFSRQRLLDALVDGVKLHKVELLLIEGRRFRTVTIDYADGPRYFVLARDESKPDVLAQILKPLTNARERNSTLGVSKVSHSKSGPSAEIVPKNAVKLHSLSTIKPAHLACSISRRPKGYFSSSEVLPSASY